jgi:hypothetical protein
MSGTKLPVRASADPYSHHFCELTEQVVWSYLGEWYILPLMSYDTTANWASFWNPHTGTKHTVVGRIAVMTFAEFKEQHGC